MIMPESFIVTLVSTLENARIDLEGTIGAQRRTGASVNFEVDLEIPSQLPFAEMKGKLLEILKILDERFYSWQDCALQYEDRFLAGSETVADVGAFDGSRLVVVKEGG